MADRTPKTRASWLAAATTLRGDEPPTAKGFPLRLGSSRCSTDAKKASMPTCMILRGELTSMAASAVSGTMPGRSEEHTSELQSLMRISYAVFCLKKKTHQNTEPNTYHMNS